MMLRCRLPGGIITPEQWLGIDNLSVKIRFTAHPPDQPPNLPIHGILKTDLKQAHRGIAANWVWVHCHSQRCQP